MRQQVYGCDHCGAEERLSVESAKLPSNWLTLDQSHRPGWGGRKVVVCSIDCAEARLAMWREQDAQHARDREMYLRQRAGGA